jgi:hypothetical protein
VRDKSINKDKSVRVTSSDPTRQKTSLHEPLVPENRVHIFRPVQVGPGSFRAKGQHTEGHRVDLRPVREN